MHYMNQQDLIMGYPQPMSLPRHAFHYSPVIDEVTGPLDGLARRKVLALFDVQNFIYSARNLGYAVSFGRLAEKLRAAASRVALHAFYAEAEADQSYFAERGYRTHQNQVEVVRSFQGAHQQSNSDNFLLFGAGMLISRSDADVVLIGSGDGTLADELAKCIAALPSTRRVATLSLAGSTSTRLDATRNPYIKTNIELGLDCLQPINTHSRRMP